ncbi:bis(5'-nucleosyl)-tetraphosphatase (symmetrical) YqeK [Pectinatus brassicae]|uniref:bis(5'-nucleosyl)-tetraphosphatase (symmetrical) n=1 Tax=Pectinatus brassicae TaxID=862415 RepID=A0A840UUH2_9FIRM|nr:bis(5'-nucleosyl)-tetraphosphatase (symmetrical) YqeK [Pectinatus brassicae]MBB5336464.1 putative HD superfamily hydrolase involved in NAD metabolism [Pectinatus brassicae]
MDYIDIVKTLKNTLKESRYIHSLSVSDTAIELAQRFNVDEQRAKLAGILHDCAREIPTSSLIEVAQKRQIKIGLIEEHQPILLHARLGAIMAQEKYGIDDNDILDAIRLHTTGSADMTDLAKIIYLADMIEPHRQYESVNRLRDLIKTSDLDTIMLNAFNDSLAFILQRGLMIHPQTILARNTLIAKNINHG